MSTGSVGSVVVQAEGVTRETVAWAREALGRSLTAWRRAAGLSQTELAGVVTWSRSTVANVETGRQAGLLLFWQRCDAALAAGGVLLAEAKRVENLALHHRQQLAVEQSRHRLATFSPSRVLVDSPATEQLPIVPAGSLMFAGVTVTITTGADGTVRVVIGPADQHGDRDASQSA